MAAGYLTSQQLIDLKESIIESENHQNPIEENLEMLPISPNPPKPCTFDILWVQYGSSESDKTIEDGSTCWELRREILNIPLKSILNCRAHPLLGVGHHGAVSKVIIKYGDHDHEAARL